MGNKTSVDLQSSPQVKSQNDLLQMFCADKCDFTSHSIDLPSGALNYIEVRSKEKANTKSKATESGDDDSDNENTLILAHGYGSGLGFFYPNYPELARQYDRVISIDWLGMGSSSRVPSKGTLAPYRGSVGSVLGLERQVTPTAAADFFVDSFEEFRRAKGLSGFTLAGHSLGGYLSARYALKYPSHIAGLVLISPVGVPSLPAPELHVPSSQLSLPLRVVQNAWVTNFTPQMYVRMRSEAAGVDSVRSTLQRRFGPDKFSASQVDLLSKYLYHITAAPPCGEYALNSLLTPVVSYRSLPTPEEVAAAQVNAAADNSGDAAASRRAASRFPPNTQVGVYAHESLEDLFFRYARAVDKPTEHDHEAQQRAREAAIAAQRAETKKKCTVSSKWTGKEESESTHSEESSAVRTPIHFPILVMYGDTDWLYYDRITESIGSWGIGPSSKDSAQGHVAGATSTVDAGASNGNSGRALDVSYVTIPSAGHHIYLDNPDAFHKAILKHHHQRVHRSKETHKEHYRAMRKHHRHNHQLSEKDTQKQHGL